MTLKGAPIPGPGASRGTGAAGSARGVGLVGAARGVGAAGWVRFEILLVLALSLGRAGVYSVLRLANMLAEPTALADQVAQINVSRSPYPTMDLIYQLLAIIFSLMPVVLAWYLLQQRAGAMSANAALGFDWFEARARGSGRPRGRVGRDCGWGAALALAVGVPGLAFYLVGRLFGITAAVEASSLNQYWWTIPVLLLAAAQNGLLEEYLVVGYLYERSKDIGWSASGVIDWRFLVASAVLRGSYHLYQGIGPFFGNVAMGLLFAWWFVSRFGKHRVMPLIVAHTLLDIVAFVGYALAPEALLRALGFSA